MAWQIQTRVLVACLVVAWVVAAADAPIRVAVWEGCVVSIHSGHETFPIFTDEHMLRLIENAARFGRSAGG